MFLFVSASLYSAEQKPQELYTSLPFLLGLDRVLGTAGLIGIFILVSIPRPCFLSTYPSPPRLLGSDSSVGTSG